MISHFLKALFDHGRVRVGHPDAPVDKDELQQADAVLQESEAIRRLSFPGTPPKFFLPAAQWATQQLYRACQAATFRELSAEALPEFLGTACPAGEPASLHYSVDLVFQFLPDLSKLTGHASPDDPLLTSLCSWANLWPLSSVGMKGVVPQSLRGIVDHPGLLQYYVDRILARGDSSRLGDVVVETSIRRTLSLYPGQFPAIAEKIDRCTNILEK